MNCKLFVNNFSDITLHSYYFSVALWERRGPRVLHSCLWRPPNMCEENGLKRQRTGEPRLNHEHSVTTANDSPQPNDFPAARLCGTHQAAGDHAHRNDRLVRIFLCVTEGWGALAEFRAGACTAGNWARLERHGCTQRSDGAGCRRTHETNRFAAPADGPNELATCLSRGNVSDRGRFVVPGGFDESIDRLADVSDVGCIPRGVHAAQTGFAGLYRCRRISWRNAWSSGMD